MWGGPKCGRGVGGVWEGCGVCKSGSGVGNGVGGGVCASATFPGENSLILAQLEHCQPRAAMPTVL